MTKEEFSKVITDLYHDICDNSSESFVRIDGYEYYIDMGYAITGIEFFMFLLKERLEKIKEES
jgi:hypothetical protein